MLYPSSHRPMSGATPPACPDCGRPVVPPSPDPRRHAPLLDHELTCPVAVADDETVRSDLTFLAGSPPGTVRQRPLSWSELANHEIVNGRPLPAGLRRRARMHVSMLGDGSIVRALVLDGITRSMTATVLRDAGAER